MYIGLYVRCQLYTGSTVIYCSLTDFQPIYNVYEISCMCQHKLGWRWEGLKFQMISSKHFNVKNQIKSVFATVCNTYCIIHCKIQMNCLINSQSLLLEAFNRLLEKKWNYKIIFLWSASKQLSDKTFILQNRIKQNNVKLRCIQYNILNLNRLG